ncbi:MAG: SpoIID/LytB domain-containing protein [Firmicutes bacterium]|nr:SpoIID/LytB domain-containing protein [Bacillota bacterium]
MKGRYFVLYIAVLIVLTAFFSPLSEARERKEVSVGITLADRKRVAIYLQDCNGIINDNTGKAVESSEGLHVFTWHEEGIKVTGPEADIGVFRGPLTILEGDNFHRVSGAVEGELYRGILRIDKDEKQLYLINILDLEEYLYGVLPREMPPSWGSAGGMEALKAQAVVARTYAVSMSGRHEKYDLCDTVHCQVYGGVGKVLEKREHENTNRAVEATRGQILTFNGKPIEAFYHATNGGYTESPQNVWNPKASYPYLVSKEDPFDDPTNPLRIRDFIVHNRARWQKHLTASTLERLLQGAGFNVGRLSALEVVSRYPSKRVKELLVKGTEGQLSLFREQTRTTFALDSQMYYIQEGDSQKVWLLGRQAVPVATDGLDESKVVTASGIKTLKGKSFFALSASSLERVPQKYFLFTGWGWGHGVGMSQNGAYNRSRCGHCYEEILDFYFSGAELTDDYGR